MCVCLHTYIYTHTQILNTSNYWFGVLPHLYQLIDRFKNKELNKNIIDLCNGNHKQKMSMV